MSHPSITVITPTLPARGQMLNRAMRSVYKQQLPAAAVAIATDVSKAGASATRQRALDMARTEWIAPLDDDDAFMPTHLLALYRHAMDTGADYVYSYFTMVGGSDPFPPDRFAAPFDPENPVETTITVLIRTELAQSVGYVPLDRGHDTNSGEDYGMLLGCLALGAKVSHLVERTWYYNFHGGNTSGLPTKGDATLWQPAS